MIAILRSQVATLIVLALALLAQLPHAAEVFVHAGHVQGLWGWFHGASYAIALELAVLLFVVQGRRYESYGFAVVSVLVNLAYYAIRVELFSLQALPAWLISLALPIAIALYSHAIADDEVRVDWSWLHVQVHKFLPQLATSEKVALPVAEFSAEEQECIVESVDLAADDAIADVQSVKSQVQDSGVSLADLRKKAQRLRNRGSMTLDEIAAQVGKSASWVSRNTEAVNS